MKEYIVFGVLAAALGLFIWGRLRHDLIALLALLALTLSGLIAPATAFLGFGHPAVITVAAVLVIGRALQNSGVVDRIGLWVERAGGRPTFQIPALCGLVLVCSAFMNNVGALALLMPVAVRVARKSGYPPSAVLMPLAFCSLLGGMTTLIGTPPNLIVASYRSGGEPFGMFDFLPVGAAVALAGFGYVVLLGWRLLPVRQSQISREALFEIKNYTAEVHVPEGAKLAGKSLRDIENGGEARVLVVGLVRGKRRLAAPTGREVIRAGDTLIVEADTAALQEWITSAGLQLGEGHPSEESLSSDDVQIVEAVVTQRSRIEGRTVRQFNLRRRYGINLLAVARQGRRLTERLGAIRIQSGDVLLLQGAVDTVYEALGRLHCLPLAERGLRVGQPPRIVLGVSIFAAALAAATLGWTTPAVALAAAAVGMILLGLVSLRDVYDSIDWSVIVLLGAMLPVGGALESTGGAQRIADWLLAIGGGLPPAATLALLLITTMTLSDVLNNAASAVIMAPISLGLAHALGVSSDPFLMAVAIGSSCAFLTPIGHQSNTLVLGPGGYRFSDYWRMGLPLEILVVVIAVPLLLVVWPL